MIEASKVAFVSSIERGRSRILGELEQAKGKPKTLFGFYDRREQIAEQFERTISPTREVYDTAIESNTVVDLPLRIVTQVEKIIDVPQRDYDPSAVDAIIDKFKSEEIEL